MAGDGNTASELPVDSSISQRAAINYWSSVSSTVDGMLGGFPQISHTDLRGSANFITKMRRQRQPTSDRKAPLKRLPRAVDCGAGIGRITKGLLCDVSDCVDIVEPIEKFTSEITHGASFSEQRSQGRIGEVFNVGLESWQPQRNHYDLIWHQWCLSQLNDAQLVAYLTRCRDSLTVGGFVVVKENMSTDEFGYDIYDETDSSVTRTDSKFRELFKAAGLSILLTELQRGFPKGLYPVRIYALENSKT